MVLIDNHHVSVAMLNGLWDDLLQVSISPVSHFRVGYAQTQLTHEQMSPLCMRTQCICVRQRDNKTVSQRVLLPLASNWFAQWASLTLQGLLSPRITTFGVVTLLKYGAISSVASSSNTCNSNGMHSHMKKHYQKEQRDLKLWWRSSSQHGTSAYSR